MQLCSNILNEIFLCPRCLYRSINMSRVRWKLNEDGERVIAQNRQSDFVINETYWFEVDGKSFSVWNLLIASNYKSPESSRFHLFDENKWLLTSRSSRSRYRQHVQQFLEQHREELPRLREKLESGGAADFLAATFSQGADSVPAVEVDGAVGLSDKLPASQFEDLQDRSTDFPDSVIDGKESTVLQASAVPDAFFQQRDDRIRVLSQSGQLLEGSARLLPPHKRKLLVSELYNSFILANNISHEKSSQFIHDIKTEDAVMDLHTVPESFRHRAKLPKKHKSQHSLIGTTAAQNGEYYHFGLYAQVKKHLARVMDATFPDGAPRPPVPCVCIDAWTDGTSAAETGDKIHVYPVAVRFIAIGVWDDDPSRQKFVPVPEKLAFMPLAVGVFVGSGEPQHPEVILRKFVYKLIMLHPRSRQDRELHQTSIETGRLWEKRRVMQFTLNLVWFIADTPARRLVKNTRAWNAGGDAGCEACTSPGIKFNQRTATSRYDMTETGLELRCDEKFHLYTSHRGRVSTGILCDAYIFKIRSCLFFLPWKQGGGLRNLALIQAEESRTRPPYREQVGGQKFGLVYFSHCGSDEEVP